eukprot:TRINITY_DN2026_c0_g1_i2.p1 TRINITY_DN2026_c0_g1~~TRINITY_DN2026_c0_g1_i2.p1  ORF type:complete len:462 (+),score=95.95 TRINITY_DN2026_c0_g1_i2:97-1482(+)
MNASEQSILYSSRKQTPSPNQGRMCFPRIASASPPAFRKSPDITVLQVPHPTRAIATPTNLDNVSRTRTSPSMRILSPPADESAYVTASSKTSSTWSRTFAVQDNSSFSNPSTAWNSGSKRRFVRQVSDRSDESPIQLASPANAQVAYPALSSSPSSRSYMDENRHAPQPVRASHFNLSGTPFAYMQPNVTANEQQQFQQVQQQQQPSATTSPFRMPSPPNVVAHSRRESATPTAAVNNSTQTERPERVTTHRRSASWDFLRNFSRLAIDTSDEQMRVMQSTLQRDHLKMLTAAAVASELLLSDTFLQMTAPGTRAGMEHLETVFVGEPVASVAERPNAPFVYEGFAPYGAAVPTVFHKHPASPVDMRTSPVVGAELTQPQPTPFAVSKLDLTSVGVYYEPESDVSQVGQEDCAANAQQAKQLLPLPELSARSLQASPRSAFSMLQRSPRTAAAPADALLV